MRDMVLFPHMISRIFVARDKSRQAVEHALASGRRVIVVAQRSGTDDRPSAADALHSVVVIANVVDRPQVDGALKVTVCGLQRTGIIRITDGEFVAAEVKAIGAQGSQSKEAADLSSAVLDATKPTPRSILLRFHQDPKLVSACLRSAMRASWRTQLPRCYRPASSRSSSSWRPVTWWFDSRD